MDIASGTHQIGPDTGALNVRTYKDGMGAKLAHDLVLVAHRWGGTVEVGDDPAACSARITIDPTSFEIIEATSGVKPLSDKDRRTIQDNITDDILETDKYPELAFASTAVSGTPPNLTVTGDVTIKDVTRPVDADVRVDGAQLTASLSVSHEAFGMKPYSAMLGAIRLRDDVDVALAVSLPTT